MDHFLIRTVDYRERVRVGLDREVGSLGFWLCGRLAHNVSGESGRSVRSRRRRPDH
ncbi:hypothetical protein CARN8_5900001 [mine drainage metagenome]|uniref:Uncharacterized protein n=1 Tax=mine drainage metagenome TaxID=410659 RepID=A0A3P3ZQQ0_9ZZZZ